MLASRVSLIKSLQVAPSLRIVALKMSTTAAKRKADDSSIPGGDLKKPKPNGSITSFFGNPKTTQSATAAGASNSEPPAATKKFDKEAWIAKLSDEQKELLKLEIETLHDSWLPYLADEIASKDFLALKKFLKAELDSGKKIYPPMEDVYSWSRHTPLPNVKALVLGQDPYINPNQAHGMCFSVRPPTKAPPSLVNIFKTLKKDYPDFEQPPNGGGLLTPWADRGVLLLNAVLTVEAGESNSHSRKGWERFTQKVIDTVLAQRRSGIVVMAWGSPAQARCKNIKGDKHLVLKSVHPSPLSAMKGFFDCGHFKKANEWLKQRGYDEIDWNLNVKPEVAGV